MFFKERSKITVLNESTVNMLRDCISKDTNSQLISKIALAFSDTADDAREFNRKMTEARRTQKNRAFIKEESGSGSTDSIASTVYRSVLDMDQDPILENFDYAGNVQIIYDFFLLENLSKIKVEEETDEFFLDMISSELSSIASAGLGVEISNEAKTKLAILETLQKASGYLASIHDSDANMLTQIKNQLSRVLAIRKMPEGTRLNISSIFNFLADNSISDNASCYRFVSSFFSSIDWILSNEASVQRKPLKSLISGFFCTMDVTGSLTLDDIYKIFYLSRGAEELYREVEAAVKAIFNDFIKCTRNGFILLDLISITQSILTMQSSVMSKLLDSAILAKHQSEFFEAKGFSRILLAAKRYCTGSQSDVFFKNSTIKSLTDFDEIGAISPILPEYLFVNTKTIVLNRSVLKQWRSFIKGFDASLVQNTNGVMGLTELSDEFNAFCSENLCTFNFLPLSISNVWMQGPNTRSLKTILVKPLIESEVEKRLYHTVPSSGNLVQMKEEHNSIVITSDMMPSVFYNNEAQYKLKYKTLGLPSAPGIVIIKESEVDAVITNYVNDALVSLSLTVEMQGDVDDPQLEITISKSHEIEILPIPDQIDGIATKNGYDITSVVYKSVPALNYHDKVIVDLGSLPLKDKIKAILNPWIIKGFHNDFKTNYNEEIIKRMVKSWIERLLSPDTGRYTFINSSVPKLREDERASFDVAFGTSDGFGSTIYKKDKYEKLLYSTVRLPLFSEERRDWTQIDKELEDKDLKIKTSHNFVFSGETFISVKIRLSALRGIKTIEEIIKEIRENSDTEEISKRKIFPFLDCKSDGSLHYSRIKGSDLRVKILAVFEDFIILDCLCPIDLSKLQFRDRGLSKRVGDKSVISLRSIDSQVKYVEELLSVSNNSELGKLFKVVSKFEKVFRSSEIGNAFSKCLAIYGSGLSSDKMNDNLLELMSDMVAYIKTSTDPIKKHSEDLYYSILILSAFFENSLPDIEGIAPTTDSGLQISTACGVSVKDFGEAFTRKDTYSQLQKLAILISKFEETNSELVNLSFSPSRSLLELATSIICKLQKIRYGLSIQSDRIIPNYSTNCEMAISNDILNPIAKYLDDDWSFLYKIDNAVSIGLRQIMDNFIASQILSFSSPFPSAAADGFESSVVCYGPGRGIKKYSGFLSKEKDLVKIDFEGIMEFVIADDKIFVNDNDTGFGLSPYVVKATGIEQFVTCYTLNSLLNLLFVDDISKATEISISETLAKGHKINFGEVRKYASLGKSILIGDTLFVESADITSEPPVEKRSELIEDLHDPEDSEVEILDSNSREVLAKVTSKDAEIISKLIDNNGGSFVVNEEIIRDLEGLKGAAKEGDFLFKNNLQPGFLLRSLIKPDAKTPTDIAKKDEGVETEVEDDKVKPKRRKASIKKDNAE